MNRDDEPLDEFKRPFVRTIAELEVHEQEMAQSDAA